MDLSPGKIEHSQALGPGYCCLGRSDWIRLPRANR
jgi:hypothetical protein